MGKSGETEAIWNKINDLSGLEKDVALLNERVMEMKADKEKANRWMMWIAGISFTAITAMLSYTNTISNSVAVLDRDSVVIVDKLHKVEEVLDDKIKEIDDDIGSLNKYINDVFGVVNEHIAEH